MTMDTRMASSILPRNPEIERDLREVPMPKESAEQQLRLLAEGLVAFHTGRSWKDAHVYVRTALEAHEAGKPLLHWSCVWRRTDESSATHDRVLQLRRRCRLLTQQALFSPMANADRRSWSLQHVDFTGMTEELAGTDEPSVFVDRYFTQRFNNLLRLAAKAKATPTAAAAGLKAPTHSAPNRQPRTAAAAAAPVMTVQMMATLAMMKLQEQYSAAAAEFMSRSTTQCTSTLNPALAAAAVAATVATGMTTAIGTTNLSPSAALNGGALGGRSPDDYYYQQAQQQQQQQQRQQHLVYSPFTTSLANHTATANNSPTKATTPAITPHSTVNNPPVFDFFDFPPEPVPSRPSTFTPLHPKDWAPVSSSPPSSWYTSQCRPSAVPNPSPSRCQQGEAWQHFADDSHTLIDDFLLEM